MPVGIASCAGLTGCTYQNQAADRVHCIQQIHAHKHSCLALQDDFSNSRNADKATLISWKFYALLLVARRSLTWFLFAMPWYPIPNHPHHTVSVSWLSILFHGRNSRRPSRGRSHESFRFPSHTFRSLSIISLSSCPSPCAIGKTSAHYLLNALSSPSGGPVHKNPTVSSTLSHWYCLGVVWFELFSSTIFDMWILRQGAAALHCIVDTIPPRTVPVKLLRYTSRMLNFEVSQSPCCLSVWCPKDEQKRDVTYLCCLQSLCIGWLCEVSSRLLFEEESNTHW